LKLVSAYNWDPDLIPILSRYGVVEAFAKLDSDVVGGGRPSLLCPRISKREAKKQIRLLQDAGIRFNYLLNGMGLGAREITRSWHQGVHRLLDWLHDAGVLAVTVSTPQVGAVVSKRHPDMEIVVSMFAGVNSVEQARMWQDLGAGVVILYENKDFSLIRSLVENTGLEVEITANLWCTSSCYQRYHHANIDTASSLSHSPHGEYVIPVCETRCTYERFSKPFRILRGQWLRPEDISFYEKLGVSRLKILDRSSSTKQMDRVLKAYAQRSYDDNLVDLIPAFSRERYTNLMDSKKLVRMARAFCRPLLYDITGVSAFKKRSVPPFMSIKGARLEGFLEGLSQRDCRVLSCDDCGYCESWARKAIDFDEDERQKCLKEFRKNIDMLDSGEFFTG